MADEPPSDSEAGARRLYGDEAYDEFVRTDPRQIERRLAHPDSASGPPNDSDRRKWLVAATEYLDRTGAPMHLQGVPGPGADRLIIEAKRLIEAMEIPDAE